MTEKQWLLKQLVKTDFANNPKYGARIDNISCARFLADVYGNKYRYCVEVKEREKNSIGTFHARALGNKT